MNVNIYVLLLVSIILEKIYLVYKFKSKIKFNILNPILKSNLISIYNF